MGAYDIDPERIRIALGLRPATPAPDADDAARLSAILGHPVDPDAVRLPTDATLAAVAAIATDWETRELLARLILRCGPDALLIPDADRLPMIHDGDGRRVPMAEADGLTEVRAALHSAPPGALGIAALMVCLVHDETDRTRLTQGWPASTITEWRDQAERAGRWLTWADARALGAFDALREYEARRIGTS
jgi:hypothetical protein